GNASTGRVAATRFLVLLRPGNRHVGNRATDCRTATVVGLGSSEGASSMSGDAPSSPTGCRIRKEFGGSCVSSAVPTVPSRPVFPRDYRATVENGSQSSAICLLSIALSSAADTRPDRATHDRPRSDQRSVDPPLAGPCKLDASG